MQFSISDVAAIAFARGFYTALAYGRGIDEAVRSGRIGILGIGRGTLEWVTPVLYLRGDDAHLFDVAPLPASPPPPRQEPVTTADTTAGATSGTSPVVAEVAHPGPTIGASQVVTAPTAATGTPDVAREVAAGPSATTGTPDAARGAPVPPRPPASVPTPPATPTSAGPPGPPASTRPPSGSPPTGPGPRHPSKRPSRAAPWITVGVIAAVAIGGAIATFLVLRPDAGGDGGGDGGDASTAELALAMDTAWTDVGLYCEQGDEFVITVTGTAYHDGTAESEVGPDGLTNGEGAQYRVLPEANTASVIGKLDTIPEMFPVGSGTTYVCPAQGGLELGINDTGLVGNSGEFHVSVVKNS
jgi:hypothetical protein